MRRGFTLLELTVGLLLSAVVLAMAHPAARGGLDRMAVVGAREEVVAALARARHAAVRYGGARLSLDSVGVVRVEAAGLVRHRVDLPSRFGVEVELGGRSREATLAFDRLGIGRAASRTVTVRRGAAEAGVVVSSYGRVRRR